MDRNGGMDYPQYLALLCGSFLTNSLIACLALVLNSCVLLEVLGSKVMCIFNPPLLSLDFLSTAVHVHSLPPVSLLLSHKLNK